MAKITQEIYFNSCKDCPEKQSFVAEEDDWGRPTGYKYDCKHGVFKSKWKSELPDFIPSDCRYAETKLTKSDINAFKAISKKFSQSEIEYYCKKYK